MLMVSGLDKHYGIPMALSGLAFGSFDHAAFFQRLDIQDNFLVPGIWYYDRHMPSLWFR